MKRICVVLLGATLLAGCAMSNSTPTPTLPPSVETPNLLPDPTDPTQLIVAGPGETFDLVLPSNSSTGYHWEIIPELDVSIVELLFGFKVLVVIANVFLGHCWNSVKCAFPSKKWLLHECCRNHPTRLMGITLRLSISFC